MSFGWGLGGGRGSMPQRFDEQYHCFSFACSNKSHLEGGDKILLPPSAFETLAGLQVDYPMLFRLHSSQKDTMTHCGVLEFTADEGCCYIPYWMMQNLFIEEGSVISVTNVSLPKATFVKLQPQHIDFLEISNPRAVLEHALRNFSCVTKGDVVCLPHNGKNYHFELKEVEPQDAACIIETDCNVDFDAPVGYKEPERVPAVGVRPGETSACPSPAPSSMSGASEPIDGSSACGVAAEEKTKPPGIRIIDGKIIRPEDDLIQGGGGAIEEDSTMVAESIGQSGVQKNAAIAVKAPTVDYWAIRAGDGARLDGKKPTTLKDKEGVEIDVRKVRAEAAARRLAATSTAANMPSAGTTLDGKAAKIVDAEAKKPSMRKSRVGSKYSRLKQSGGFAFEGSANSLKK